MATNASRWIWALTTALFASVAVVAWIEVRPLLYPEVSQVAPLNDACDLRMGACEALFADGSRVSFELSPRHIPLVQELKLTVHIDGIDAKGVEVDFAGVDMSMGFNRARLDPVNPGEFSGAGVLPVCVRNRMRWEAKVLLQTDQGLLAAPFRFDTFR